MRPEIIGVFIPIVAIVMGIGIGMLAIWSEHKRKAQLLEQYHKERIIALERGLPLPELDRQLVAMDEECARMKPQLIDLEVSLLQLLVQGLELEKLQ